MSVTTSPLPKQHLDVDGKSMAYFDSGTPAEPASVGLSPSAVVFLHGNPTSSYLWRNIIPSIAGQARCIAPDLIGQGDSAKLDDPGPGRYTFATHRHYLDGLLDQLDLGDRVVFVIHDWGSALGFDWANRHRDRVAGIAYMEAIVRPIASWEDWPEAARGVFQGFRSDAGESMVIDKNIFVERVLPASIARPLSDDEMNEYRRPFTEPQDRWPTLTWPRQIPIEGEPADVTEIVNDYAQWLQQSEVPKLFVNADPGSILVGAQRDFCRSWPNQQEVTVSGIHFVQEDSPVEIADAITAWMNQQ